MKFTNDIKFSNTPTSNETIKLTYKGNLFKNKSEELYIVYGFGENWDNTTEQKMERRSYGFVTNIKMQNYNTFNFCFRNSDYIWDNNNSFNYISSITSQTTTSEIESLSKKEADAVCSNSIDNILNSIDLELDNNKTTTLKMADDLNVLDALIQELYEEYTSKNQNIATAQEIESNNQTSSLSNENSVQITESVFDNFFKDIQEIDEPSNVEYFSELTQLFDEIITNIENPNNSLQSIDVGIELNNIFEEIFKENVQAQHQETENYIPESDSVNIAIDNEDLNKTFSDIIKNISKVNTETNSVVDTLKYDYSDFNEMFAFAQKLNTEESEEEKIFDFSKSIFDFEMNKNAKTVESIETSTEKIFNFSNNTFDFEITKNTQPIKSIETSTEEIFNFSNTAFDFEIDKNINTIEIAETAQSNSLSNQFSDSFYDDEDISVHENYTSFQEIVNSITTELEQEVENANLFHNEDISSKESEAFETAVNEYAQYFDNLIEEIVSTSTSTLSTSVSTAQVLENENTNLAVTETENTAIASTPTETYNETSTDGVPDEYALYDYKSHSFLYMIKRRFKQIFSALFTKLPKLFGKESQNENN